MLNQCTKTHTQICATLVVLSPQVGKLVTNALVHRFIYMQSMGILWTVIVKIEHIIHKNVLVGVTPG